MGQITRCLLVLANPKMESHQDMQGFQSRLLFAAGFSATATWYNNWKQTCTASLDCPHI